MYIIRSYDFHAHMLLFFYVYFRKKKKHQNGIQMKYLDSFWAYHSDVYNFSAHKSFR